MTNMKSLNGYGFDASALGGKAPEYYIQPRNLLDNSDFRNPVNQRGASSYSGNTYTIDRWYTYSSVANIVLGTGYITIQNSALMQRIDVDPDKTYTAAVCKADGSIAVVSGTFTENFGDVEIGIRCSISGDYPRFLMEPVLGNVAWAALYEGTYTADTLPPYVPKGYAAELAECQRYLPFAINAGEGEYRSIGTGTALSESDIRINIPLPTSPRAVPNFYCNDITALMLRGASYITPTNISLDIYSMNSITITCTVSGAVAGGAYELIAKPGVKLLMTSEL